MRRFLISLFLLFSISALVFPQGVIKLQWKNVATGCCSFAGAVVTDTFDRADSAVTMGTASDGIHAWTAGDGVWGISSNKAYTVTPGSIHTGGETSFVTVNYGSPDAVIQVTISGESAHSGGIVFNYIDNNNFEAIYSVPIFGEWRYECVVGGAEVDASLMFMVPVPDPTTIKVILHCGTHEFFVDGASVFGPFNNLGGQFSNKHGLSSADSSASVRWDNFSITHCTP